MVFLLAKVTEEWDGFTMCTLSDAYNYAAMFCLNDTMRYFLCPGKTDMRKGINSLCGVVHDGWDMTSVWAMSSSS